MQLKTQHFFKMLSLNYLMKKYININYANKFNLKLRKLNIFCKCQLNEFESHYINLQR